MMSYQPTESGEQQHSLSLTAEALDLNSVYSVQTAFPHSRAYLQKIARYQMFKDPYSTVSDLWQACFIRYLFSKIIG